MLRIYDKFETDFTSNGLCVPENAAEVKIHKEINGEWELTFKLSPHDEKRRYIVYDNIVVVDGQGYRINSIDNDSVSAVPLYRDAAERHMPTTGEFIGKRPREIMGVLFRKTPIHIMTHEEVEALGMEWVTDTTDVFEQSRVTPIGGLTALMEQLDKYHVHNELYFDNYNIALVKQIGADHGYKIDLRLNSDEITPTIDSSEIITRLYPYGKNGLEITHAHENKTGYAFIDSPYLANNTDGNVRIKEGFINFDEIDNPDELYEAGMKQFREDNPERIDNPKYSLKIKCYQRGGEVSVGDIVEVNDVQNGIISKQRVVAMEYYPYEPNRSEITVGTPTMTLQDVIKRSDYSYVKNKLTTNERGELKTSWLEMMQRNESISINNDLDNQEIALYKTGSLYESSNAAIAIINGRLAIADHKDEKTGKWKWTTIMNAGEVIVNEVYTGALYTDLVHILSEDGTLKIENNLIQMFDEKGTLRFRAGYVTRDENGGILPEAKQKYVFELYDANAKKNVSVDDGGNITMRGAFMTGTSGEQRIIIDGNGIQSYNSNNLPDGIYSKINTEYGRADGFYYYSGGKEVFGVFKNALGWDIMHFGGNIVLTKTSENGDILLSNVKSKQMHNHGIRPGTKLAIYNDDGSLGWVPWEATMALN